MFNDKLEDFILQMSKKGYGNFLNSKSPNTSLSKLTESALKSVSGGQQCQDCIYLSFNKSV